MDERTQFEETGICLRCGSEQNKNFTQCQTCGKPYPIQKISQSQIILDYLKAGFILTTLNAVNIIGSVKLTSRISELRAKGHKIESRKIHHNKKTYNEYFIRKENK